MLIPSYRTGVWSAFVNSEYSADTYTLKYTGGYQRYWYDTTTDADASAAEDSGVDWTQDHQLYRYTCFQMPLDLR